MTKVDLLGEEQDRERLKRNPEILLAGEYEPYEQWVKDMVNDNNLEEANIFPIIDRTQLLPKLENKMDNKLLALDCLALGLLKQAVTSAWQTKTQVLMKHKRAEMERRQEEIKNRQQAEEKDQEDARIRAEEERQKAGEERKKAEEARKARIAQLQNDINTLRRLGQGQTDQTRQLQMELQELTAPGSSQIEGSRPVSNTSRVGQSRVGQSRDPPSGGGSTGNDSRYVPDSSRMFSNQQTRASQYCIPCSRILLIGNNIIDFLNPPPSLN